MKMYGHSVGLRGGLTAVILAIVLAIGTGASFAQESGESEPVADESAQAEQQPAEAADQEESEPAAETELAVETDDAGDEAPADDPEPADEGIAAEETGAEGTLDAGLADETETESSSSSTSGTPATDDPAGSATGAGDTLDPDPVESTASENGGEAAEISTRDPLEGMNRVFFKFNDTLDRLFLKPIAKIYRTIMPTFVQDRVRNVINNSKAPVILANDILQWKWGRAGDTTARFFINSTIGLGGIFEVAEGWGIKRHDEDFGQTLGVWGVGEWLYLYLPFVGPTNPRDMVGKAVDRYFDPLTYYADVIRNIDFSDSRPIKFNIDTAGIAQLARGGMGLLDLRARNIDTLDEIERTSIDFYAGVRSLYRQSRESAINDGKVDFEDLPDLSDEFE